MRMSLTGSQWKTTPKEKILESKLKCVLLDTDAVCTEPASLCSD